MHSYIRQGQLVRLLQHWGKMDRLNLEVSAVYIEYVVCMIQRSLRTASIVVVAGSQAVDLLNRVLVEEDRRLGVRDMLGHPWLAVVGSPVCLQVVS